jgi:hypothetical protein
MDTATINQSAQLALQDALNVLPLTLAPNALTITY